MVDLETYRIRIGTFQQKSTLFHRKNDKIGFKPVNMNPNLTRIVLLLVIMQSIMSIGYAFPPISEGNRTQEEYLPSSCSAGSRRLKCCCSDKLNQKYMEEYLPAISFIRKSNFWARYINGNGPNSRGLKNCHLNIRSIGNKISELKYLIRDHSPHIFGISECELRKPFNVEKLKLPGYDILLPKSWNSQGFARVIVYVKKTLSYVQVDDLQEEDVQSVWLKGGFKNGKSMYFCHFYREHTSTLGSSLASQRLYLQKLLQQWETACHFNNPNDHNELHIAGDMNIDVLYGRWLAPGYHLLSLARMVETSCTNCNLIQLVKGPTRKQFNSIANTMSQSCIDHIYTNAKYRCSDPAIISFGGSDHDLVSYVRFSKEPPSQAITIKKRSYRGFNTEKYVNDLSQIDFTDVLSCPDIDIAVELLTGKIKSVLEEHAPWVGFQKRKKFAPWLTASTLELMKERDLLKAKASDHAAKGFDSTELWNKYKQIRNSINNRRKFEEKKYKAELISQNLSSSADTWKVAKNLMEWSSNSGPPNQLEVAGKLTTKASEIASLMNNFFIEKIQKIRRSIESVPLNFNYCKKIMEKKKCTLGMDFITIARVNKLLKGLKNSRSTSIDGLDNFCVRIAADIIDKPLHHIICLSVMQSKFPEAWKLSKVVPLHKKQSKLEMKNYRPVSILSPLSKVLEKAAYQQLYKYFSMNKIFHENMHGYRAHRSTQTALLSIYDKWIRAAEKGQVSGAVLLDLSAAFDLVDSSILLKKLKIYGIGEDFIAWIKSYLDNRKQAVWINSVLSQFLINDIGVPQGSNLGPLFFAIYFNDLLFALDCEAENYADDTTLIATGSSVDEISDILNRNCETVNTWMRSNMLKLNADKTHVLTIGTKERLQQLPYKINIVMDNQNLEEDESGQEVLLGCKVSADLKWYSHIKSLKAKLSQRLVALSQLQYVAPFHIKKSVAEGIFNGVLAYCLPLFGGTEEQNIKELQVLQNRAAQVVCNTPLRFSRQKLFDKVEWLSVNQMVVYYTLMTVFQIRRNGQPEYLSEILRQDTRGKRIFRSRAKLSLTLKSFTFRGAALWNELPLCMRTEECTVSFKKKLQDWVYENIARFLN